VSAIRPLLIALAVALAPGAARADAIVLHATPIPVVDVQVNGRPARFEVDTTLPDVAVINPAAAARLQVRPAPMIRAAVTSDDLSITGRVARPRIVFSNGEASRSLAGLFGAPYRVGDLDGAIGPGVLPFDRVRIVLRPGGGGAHHRTLPLTAGESWRFAAPVGDAQGALVFNLARNESVLSRAATSLFERLALMTPTGDVSLTQYPLGLSTRTQPVRTAQTLAGFALGPTLARTTAPLLAPDGIDTVVVTPGGRERPVYEITLGREALAGCGEMIWERRTKRIVITCD
jgi:hypothetical protein